MNGRGCAGPSTHRMYMTNWMESMGRWRRCGVDLLRRGVGRLAEMMPRIQGRFQSWRDTFLEGEVCTNDLP